MREKIREMFRHSFDNYMRYAYPHDELKPVSCAPRSRDDAEDRGSLDDALGDFSLTLVRSPGACVCFLTRNPFARSTLWIRLQ
jgi:hypothetical protein